MAEKSGDLHCPLCGSEIGHVTEETRKLLISLLLGDIAHRIIHRWESEVTLTLFHISDMEKNMINHNLRTETGKVIKESVLRMKRSLTWLKQMRQYFYDLNIKGLVKELREIVKEIEDANLIFGHKMKIDFTPLAACRERIEASVYLLIFLIGLQDASIAVSAYRNASVEISFAVKGDKLETQICICYEHSYFERSNMWNWFKWAIHLAGGDISINQRNERELVIWHFPLS